MAIVSRVANQLSAICSNQLTGNSYQNAQFVHDILFSYSLLLRPQKKPIRNILYIYMSLYPMKIIIIFFRKKSKTTSKQNSCEIIPPVFNFKVISTYQVKYNQRSTKVCSRFSV